LSSRGALANIPVLVFFYVLLVLPFMGGDGSPRMENILFWPTLAGITIALAVYNHSLFDKGTIWSPPIASLAVYLAFAGASITWAFSPDFAFSRYVLQLLAITIILLPYALPIDTSRTVQRLHVCFVMGVAVNAYFVLVTPGTSIGHTGYFVHKQELGMFCGGALILSLHELLFRGWRRWLAVLSIGLTLWVIFASQSKASLAFMLVAPLFAAVALVLCKLLRTSPAFIVGGVVLGFVVLDRFWSDPVGRIAWYLYGDHTLTGRTYIWDFINYIVSQRSWFGWGFHSYWNVPNSPHNQAPGFVKDMISTHSGYLELRLDTGTIGYWLFLVFVYASLHVIEPVRRKDPIRAWLFLSIATYVLLLNMIESIWVNMGPLWILYVITVGEAVRFSRSENASAASSRPSAPARHRARSLPHRTRTVE
jgi:O-antigen ligase